MEFVRRRLGAIACSLGGHRRVKGTWVEYCSRCQTVLRERAPGLLDALKTRRSRTWRA